MKKQKYIYNTWYKKALRSITLDVNWIFKYTLKYKWSFIFKKYLFILLPRMFWDHNSQSYKITLCGRYIHMETILDIGFIQSTLLDYTYLVSRIPLDATVIDIGAHIGEFALFAESFLHPKTIYSFEPVLASFALLQKNIPAAHAFHAAICTTPSVTMHIPNHTCMSSGVVSSKSGHKEISPGLFLDSIPEIQNEKYIDLIKIDVEGMEYDVLLASSETLKKTRYIMLEISIDRTATKSALHTITHLTSTIPSLSLIHIGTVFGDTLRTDSVDLLFDTHYSPR
jgi:FkbM family methyltransferase